MPGGKDGLSAHLRRVVVVRDGAVVVGEGGAGAAVVVGAGAAVVGGGTLDSVCTRSGGSSPRLGTPAMATPRPAPTRSMSK